MFCLKWFLFLGVIRELSCGKLRCGMVESLCYHDSFDSCEDSLETANLEVTYLILQLVTAVQVLDLFFCNLFFSNLSYKDNKRQSGLQYINDLRRVFPVESTASIYLDSMTIKYPS